MSFLSRIFSPKSPGLHCPRCEKPIDGHDEGACARRMSRRFFFGTLAGGVAAAVVPRIPTGGLFDPVRNIAADYADMRDRTAALVLARGSIPITVHPGMRGILELGDLFTVPGVHRGKAAGEALELQTFVVARFDSNSNLRIVPAVPMKYRAVLIS